MSIILTAYVIFIIFSLAGLVWSAFSGMGTLLIFLSALFFGIISSFELINIATLIFLFTLFLLGELLEYLLVLAGAKGLGSSRDAAWGALAGAFFGLFAGIFVGGVVGILPFVLLGIFLGGFLVELRDRRGIKQALKSGAGGLFGRGGAVLTKVFITIIMIAIVIYNLITSG